MFTACWIGLLAVKGEMDRGLFLGVLMITLAVDLVT